MQGFEAERLQDLGEVLLWYELQLSLLNEEDRRLPQLLQAGPIPGRYLDSSLDELRKQFARAGNCFDMQPCCICSLPPRRWSGWSLTTFRNEGPSPKSPAASAGLDGNAAGKLG